MSTVDYKVKNKNAKDIGSQNLYRNSMYYVTYIHYLLSGDYLIILLEEILLAFHIIVTYSIRKLTRLLYKNYQSLFCIIKDVTTKIGIDNVRNVIHTL